MNTSELIERVRRTCFFTSATHPDFTDAVILDELYDQQAALFGRNIINARAGYWLHTASRTMGTPSIGQGLYQIPSRACAGGLESVQILASAGDVWVNLPEMTESQAQLQDLPPGQTAYPAGYVIRGDRIVLIPESIPFSQLRFKYYQRPSVLVLPQDGRAGSTERGRITAVNPTTGTITVNTIPFDMSLSSPVALTGNKQFDVVRSDASSGWSEVIFSGLADFSAGTTLTVTATSGSSFFDIVPASSISFVVDYVRLIDQSEYPQLPKEFHRALADAVSVKILSELGLNGKAQAIGGQLAADLNRFQDLITPRTKSAPKDIVAPQGLYRGNARGWTVRFP